MVKVRTICPRCSVGCGVVVRAEDGRAPDIEGDPLHPANRGRLCPTGEALGESAGLEGRLLTPEIGVRPAGWDRALDLVARRLTETIDRHGRESIAFALSGDLLTEDYYVANKLMKGFIGAANIDVRAPESPSGIAAAHIRSFGEDVVSGSFDDLDQADLILLLDVDPACTHPVLHRRMVAACKERGATIIVVNSAPAEAFQIADLHIPLRPGADAALMTGLLAHCRRAGIIDAAFIAGSVSAPEGFWEELDEGHDLWSTARACDLAPADLQRFYDLFTAHPRTVTLFGPSIDASAVINLHLATGRIGRRGAAPFALAGLPNIMGAREVGSVAATLAAHRDFIPDNRAIVRRFWAAPAMADRPGVPADGLSEAVLDGRIKALWIMGDIPPASLSPEARAACPLLICSTSRSGSDADIRLPSAAWGEKDGTFTNAERLISRQRPFLSPAGDARADWWIVNQVARRMGWRDAFTYDHPADVYREHARLSAYRNEGARLFDLRRHASISNPAYDGMMPSRWGGDVFADGRFPKANGKARLVPTGG